MATTITFKERLDLESDDNLAAETETENHYLPFKIQFDGQRDNIRCKFVERISSTADKDPKVLQNYFRGRSIQGDKINLNHYEGFCVQEENRKDESVDDADKKHNEKQLTITSKFDKMTYWNWDKIPTQMDAPVKLMDWLELAQVLHESINPNSDGHGMKMPNADLPETNGDGNK